MADDVFGPLLEWFSKTFLLPSYYFVFPNLIFYFLIPLGALTYVWYVLIHKKLRIFRNPDICTAISLMFALFSTPFIALAGPGGTIAIAIGTSMLVMGRFSLRRILTSMAVLLAIRFIYPIILAYMSSFFII